MCNMTNFERGFRDAILKLAEEPSVRVVLREVADDDKTDSATESSKGSEASSAVGKNTVDTEQRGSSSSTNSVANTVSSSR